MTVRRLVVRIVCGGWLVVVGSAAVSQCTDAEAPVCEQGDRIQCRCGDGTYGYQRCDQGGHFDGGCECTIGLGPDAGVPPDTGSP